MKYQPEAAARQARAMQGPLADRLALIATDFRERLADYSGAIDNMVARLRAGRASDAVPSVGDVFPDFILPDSRGNLWHLADAMHKGPVVLAFHRGYWCDFCHLNMAALAEVSPQIAATGGQLVAISPQNARNAKLLAHDAGATFDVLCDIGLGVATVLGLCHVISDDLQDQLARLQVDLNDANLGTGSLLPITATFVLRPDGRIAARHVDPDPRLRMAIDHILQATAAVQSAARS